VNSRTERGPVANRLQDAVLPYMAAKDPGQESGWKRQNLALIGHQRNAIEAHTAGDIDDFGDLLELQLFAAAYE
jgi:hypothetical protein